MNGTCVFNSLEKGTKCEVCERVLTTTLTRHPTAKCGMGVKLSTKVLESKRAEALIKQPPGLIKQSWNYAKAVANWKLAGSPQRNQEEINSTLAICVQCPHYINDKRPHCKLCGCSLNSAPNGLVNKIAMATEGCPDNPPRWNPTYPPEESMKLHAPNEIPNPIVRPVWSYGILTVPSRLATLLPVTMQSLCNAGFDNPIVFFDGDPQGPIPENSVVNRVGVGHLANWMTALFHLYTVKPHSRFYALFEDDCLAVSNLKEYLERSEYPQNGYWNLITHDDNVLFIGHNEGWHESNQKGRGAVGLVFDNTTVKQMLTDQRFIEKPLGSKKGGVDGAVANVMKNLKRTEYVHYPSLLEHIGGGQSTMGHKYGKMRAFKGEDFNPLALL